MIYRIATAHLAQLCERVFGKLVRPQAIGLGDQKLRGMVDVLDHVLALK